MAQVLAIDDDSGVLLFLKTGLAHMGFGVRTADTAEAGFRLACRKRVDAILLDIAMPGTDGLSLLKKLKSDERTCHIPVVMFTGQDNQEFKEQACFDYAEFYVMKTAGIQEIAGRLRQAIAVAPHAPRRWSLLVECMGSLREAARVS
jgi:DNA-binding response OmpR family regulator